MSKTAITVALVVFLIFIAFNTKANSIPDGQVNGLNQFQRDFNYLKVRYGNDLAKIVEKIYRLETNHFKSEQYKNTYSAGMLAFGSEYPYGWSSPQIAWEAEPQFKPIGIYPMNVNGRVYNYLKFNDLRSGLIAVAEHIKNMVVPVAGTLLIQMICLNMKPN